MTLIVTSDYELQKLVPPSLPLAVNEYSPQYQDQLNNVLRLYFNRLNNVVNQLNAQETGASIVLPHISASSDQDQSATANDTPTMVGWTDAASMVGFTLDAGAAVCEFAGVYNITYGLQLANTDNDIHFATIWLKVNNVDVPNSSVKFTLPARKSSLLPYEMLAYSSIAFEVDVDDEVTLWWATEQAYDAGVADGVYIKAEPAATSPYARPAIPSAIGSIVFVSASV